MDYFIYNILGYKTEKIINESAKKIQKAYRDYRSYQIKKRIDIIQNKIPEKKIDSDREIYEENIYWQELRNSVKDKTDWCFI